MRYFTSLEEAVSEIRRDLAKSPTVTSSRVQNKAEVQKAHEAMNYAYTIPSEAIPPYAKDLVKWGREHFPYWKCYDQKIENWLINEETQRVWADVPVRPEHVADHLHPELESLQRSAHFDYTYNERMQGAVHQIVTTLQTAPDTRRAYWSIWNPLDQVRAHQFTRIPCSLGYHFAIREVEGLGLPLQATYLQRSADFDKFWLSDLYLGVAFQRQVVRLYNGDRGTQTDPIWSGNFSHIILSFHAFIEEEVF